MCVCLVMSASEAAMSPGFSVHGDRNVPGENTGVRCHFLFKNMSFWPTDQTCVSYISGRFFTVSRPQGEVMNLYLESCYFGGIMAASSAQPHKMSCFLNNLGAVFWTTVLYCARDVDTGTQSVCQGPDHSAWPLSNLHTTGWNSFLTAEHLAVTHSCLLMCWPAFTPTSFLSEVAYLGLWSLIIWESLISMWP